MLDTVRGTIRVRVWPRRRGPSATDHLTIWQVWLNAVNWAWRYLPGTLKRYYIDAARPPALQARDIFTATLYGSMWSITTVGGRTYYPMAALETLSKTLDIFGSQVGTILARHTDYWRSVSPGQSGYVLMSQGIAGPPHWAPLPETSPMPLLWSAGTFDPQGSLSITKTHANGVVTMQWHMSAPNHVGLNIPRPSTKTKLRLHTLLRFPSTASGNVMLFWQANGFRTGQQPGEVWEDRLLISSPGTDLYTWYTSNWYQFPIDAEYLALTWGRRGEHQQDTYGDYVHAAMFRVELQ